MNPDSLASRRQELPPLLLATALRAQDVSPPSEAPAAAATEGCQGVNLLLMKPVLHSTQMLTTQH